MSKLIQIATWSPTPQANVVFVHGLMGDAYATWRRGHEAPSSDPTFWPLWLSADVPGLQIFTLSYDAPISNWLGTTMALQDRAANILEVLLAEPALRARPTYFICHSLGGLIVKQVILSLKEQEERSDVARKLLAQVKKVVFIATPHTGSAKASLLGRLGFLVWPSAIARSLVANDSGLRKVNISYRGLADDRRNVLSHKIFYETQETAFGGIVEEASADPGLHANPIPIDANHITIAKPRDRAELLYIGVEEFLRYDIDASFEGVSSKKNLPPVDIERSWNLIPKLARVAALIAFFGTAYYIFAPERFKRPEIDPRTVAEAYLAAFDRGDFDAAWRFWDVDAKAGVGGFDGFKRIAANNLAPLGAMQSRLFTGTPSEMISPSGYPRGLYSGATYKTKFATDCRAESIMLRTKNDRKWQVFGHQLSAFAIPC